MLIDVIIKYKKKSGPLCVELFESLDHSKFTARSVQFFKEIDHSKFNARSSNPNLFWHDYTINIKDFEEFVMHFEDVIDEIHVRII